MTPLNFEIAMAKEFGAATAVDQPVSLHDEAAAVEFRLREIEPVWRVFDAFVFDFTGVASMTGGFAYALFGRLAEQHGSWINDKLSFKNIAIILGPVIPLVISKGIQQHDSQPKA